IATFFAFEAKREAREKESQRQEAETQKANAQAETRRVKSSLKTSQLLRVELVGKGDPRTAWALLRDEDIYPTAERDFAWGIYNHWCERTGDQKGLERASLERH